MCVVSIYSTILHEKKFPLRIAQKGCVVYRFFGNFFQDFNSSAQFLPALLLESLTQKNKKSLETFIIKVDIRNEPGMQCILSPAVALKRRGVRVGCLRRPTRTPLRGWRTGKWFAEMKNRTDDQLSY